MKKWLIASYNLEVGGIEKALVNLLKNIPQEYEITLLLQEEKGTLLEQLPQNIIRKTYTISKSRWKLLRKIYNRLHLIAFILKNYHHYDGAICYATYDIPSSILTRYLGKKSILWIHSNYVMAYRDSEKVKAFFDQRKISKFDQWVFVSEEAKKDLEPFYPMVKEAKVINNLIDFDEIKRKAQEKIAEQKEKNTLLFVGRLEESSKGLFRLLEIMKQYQEQKIERHLWLVGDGPDREKYETYCQENNLHNVRFLGMKKNPYAYMQKCDVLMLPSYYEGFPVVILEALSLGKKVVTTIDVSCEGLNLKEYVYLTEREATKLQKTIDFALTDQGKKKFDCLTFNQLNLVKTLALLGDENEI